jgi:hypothetical protein
MIEPQRYFADLIIGVNPGNGMTEPIPTLRPSPDGEVVAWGSYVEVRCLAQNLENTVQLLRNKMPQDGGVRKLEAYIEKLENALMLAVLALRAPNDESKPIVERAALSVAEALLKPEGK